MTPNPNGHVSEQPEDEFNDDDTAEFYVDEDARGADNDDEDDDADDSIFPEGEDNRGRDDSWSKITEDIQMEILE
jgi:hypothetical protein